MPGSGHRLERLGQVGGRHVVELGQPARRAAPGPRAGRPGRCSSGSTTRRASLIRISRILDIRDMRRQLRRYGPGPMPTAAEVKAQLTGPGGMFEVVDRGGPRATDAGVQEPDAVAALGGRGGRHAGRRPDVPRLRRPHVRLHGVRPHGQRCGPRATRSLRPAAGRPRRRPQPEQPRVVPHVLGHRPAGRGAGGPQRVVDHRRDRVRPAGLRRQGAGGRPEALRAHRRLPRPRARPRARVPHRLLARRRRPGRRQAGAQPSASSPPPPPPPSPMRTSPRTTPR